MSRLDKILLVGSLSFFFACMALALVSLRQPPAESYMYSPTILDETPIAPEDDKIRKYEKYLPRSVLNYPSIDEVEDKPEVLCYLGEKYNDLIAARKVDHGATLVATAAMEKDRLEIYKTADNNFFVFVVGPDAAGEKEACEVAKGTDWALTEN